MHVCKGSVSATIHHALPSTNGIKTMKMHVSLVLALVLTAGGCVTGTRTIQTTVPETTSAVDARGTVFLGDIADKRSFEENASQADVPSVRGKLSETTPEQRAHLIGRQRNGFGKAMGDLELANNATVQQEIRRLLEAGFAARGYAVSNTPNADVKVTTGINKFWAWFRPGFWKIGFDTDIACDITVDGANGSRRLNVVGNGLNNGQIASDANWQLSLDRAYSDFLKNLNTALEQAGY